MRYTEEQIKAKLGVVVIAAMLICISLFVLCIAIGFMFGVQWGLVAIAVLIFLIAVSLIVLLAIDRKLLRLHASDDDTSINHIVVSDTTVPVKDRVAAREEWDAIAREASDERKTVA